MVSHNITYDIIQTPYGEMDDLFFQFVALSLVALNKKQKYYIRRIHWVTDTCLDGQKSEKKFIADYSVFLASK